MDIFGYSERGIVNALFYEMGRHKEHEAILQGFIKLAKFPFCNEGPIKGQKYIIIIEQSFSDFGDADAIVLIENNQNKKCMIFIEAKVKTSSKGKWEISREYNKFQKGLKTKVSSSNLFTQLYHKSRLIQALKTKTSIESLTDKGVNFPNWSTKKTRKIGNNPVVKESIKIIRPYIENVYYLAIVPGAPKDTEESIKNFKDEEQITKADKCETTNYGYLTWEDIKNYCNDKKLEGIIKVFKYNDGQIH